MPSDKQKNIPFRDLKEFQMCSALLLKKYESEGESIFSKRTWANRPGIGAIFAD